MGRNSQARREQKRRDKKKRGAQGARAKNVAISVHELSALCEPLVKALKNQEPPPPSLFEHWESLSISVAGASLRTQLASFIRFVFLGGDAGGDLQPLQPHKSVFESAGLSWLYSLLHAYCLLSDPVLLADTEALQEAVAAAPLPEGCVRKDVLQIVYAPLWLLLFATGRKNYKAADLQYLLRAWLDNGPFEEVVPALKKFLLLKNPRADLKTVAQLEASLASAGVPEEHGGCRGLSALLALHLKQRLSAAQRDPSLWRALPYMARMGQLLGGEESPVWTQLDLRRPEMSVLHRLSLDVSEEAMDYREKVALAVIKCRAYAAHSFRGEVLEEDFERSLEALIHLLGVGVPSEQQVFAEKSLNSVCDWLAEAIGSERAALPRAPRLRGLQRLRPRDYRVALLAFLASGGKAPSGVEGANQHINAGLFVFALQVAMEVSRQERANLLRHFFWPLSGETKKLLAIRFCQRALFVMESDEARECWRCWLNSLLAIEQAPFSDIVKGQACEVELLLYLAMATRESAYGCAWLQAAQLPVLVRAIQRILDKTRRAFAVSQVCLLLNALAEHSQAAALFDDWPPLLSIVNTVSDLREIEPFLALMLPLLIEAEAIEEVNKANVMMRCRAYPELAKYLPRARRPAAKRRSKKAKKTKA